MSAIELLSQYPNWVCWKLEERNGKLTKVPKNPNTGGNAQSNNPATWGTYEEATHCRELANFDGIGFMLDPGTVKLVGFDLDDCLDNGTPKPWAQDIITTLDSYTEITPSDNGLRVFLFGDLPPTGRHKDKIECYTSGRFLTVTGNHLDGTPTEIKHREKEILTVHRQVFGEPEEPKPAQPSTPTNLNDQALLKLATSASNGAKFADLWTGKITGYPSASEADLGLALMLAFWAGGDSDQMDRLFRTSGLMRDKWDVKHKAGGETYGQMTIAKALELQTEFYTPPVERSNGTVPSPPEPPFENELPVKSGSSWETMAGIIGPVKWAWEPWLPLGLLTMIVSESGTGKSALALRIASCFLREDPWPDGKPFDLEAGHILWCEAEAAQAINLDRAKKWGLPIERILTPLDDPLEDIQLDNPEHQGAIISVAQRDEVRFIVVDSLSGGTRKDGNKANDMMIVVKLLAELARNTKKPVLLTHHLRKRGMLDSGDKITLDRVRDSSAIVQPARVIWALDTPDPEDTDNRRLSVIKNNLARFAEPIGLRVGENGVTFGDAPEPPKQETLQDQAADFLMSILAKGPVPSSKIQEEIEQAGLSWPAAKQAKKKMGIVSVKPGGIWHWSLPQKDEIPF